MLEFIILFYIAFIVFALIALWKLAVKAGRKGWELYIPIYSYYVLYKIAGMDIYWFIMQFIPLVFVLILGDSFIVLLITYIFSIMLSFIFCIKLANKFNKGIGFGFGLFFLNPIFMAILAFDKKCIYNK